MLSHKEPELPEKYLTRSEVAALLGVSPTTVTRWAREGRLPCQKTLGGHHRFERSVVEQIRARMRQGGLPGGDSSGDA